VYNNKAFGMGWWNRAISPEKQPDRMTHCIRLNEWILKNEWMMLGLSTGSRGCELML